MTRLFIGGLSDDTTRTQVEQEFKHFGHISDIFVARNPPGFGFVVFDNKIDADDAIRDMDGQVLFGSKIRVELARARGAGSGGGGGGGGGGRGRGSMSDVKCYNCSGFGHMSRECTKSRSYGYGSNAGGGRRRSR